MTETHEERRARLTARAALPERLEAAGDPLHLEAAAEIRRLRQEIDQTIRDAEREARDAYREGSREGFAEGRHAGERGNAW